WVRSALPLDVRPVQRARLYGRTLPGPDVVVLEEQPYELGDRAALNWGPRWRRQREQREIGLNLVHGAAAGRWLRRSDIPHDRVRAFLLPHGATRGRCRRVRWRRRVDPGAGAVRSVALTSLGKTLQASLKA